MDQIEADTGRIIDKLESWIEGSVRLVPNMIAALAILLLFYLLGRLLARWARHAATRRGRANLGDVAGALVRWMVMILAVMLAVTIIAPSITPADLFGALGIGSVAIGFAFKDILQNLLAGVLILVRQPFEVGDQIAVSGGHEGTVERIETRATLIRTYDNRRVVIPNSDIYTDSVVVKTAFATARSEYDVLIGCSDDFDTACRVMVDTCRAIDGILSDPAPEAIPWAMEADGNLIRLRWWTASDRASTVGIWGRVIQRVYAALDAEGVDLPYPTRVLLLHDQTEDTDGDRTRQREGWPAGAGDVPRQSRIADALSRRGS
ncbi:mechanosensitive ion channel family protein [Palleronia rufa]|uniref:mechanosensitive ion channel family protein n=1 Tax=Palleronia rufa TaxID=1530186 RepID=UPI00068CFECD|nr:mechanosensitive ion channel family protein [Palleronia rufa]